MTVPKVNTTRLVTPIEPVDDSYEGLAICEKYNTFVLYIYPVILGMENRHHVFKTLFIQTLFDQHKHFYEAAKSDQISKLYLSDANLATIREWLRFCKNKKYKMVSLQQYKTASILLSEVGSMLGAWIKQKKKK